MTKISIAFSLFVIGFFSLTSCAERGPFAEAWYATEIQPIECHVRFVDQDGKPAINAPIAVAIYTSNPDATPGKPRELPGLKTDDAGEFHLTGERGGNLWLKLSDPLYLHGATNPGSIGGTMLRYTRTTSEGNRNYGTTSNPAVILVWKKEGPQSLVTLKGEVVVQFKGVPFRIDLIKGCLVDEGGDLIIEPRMPMTEAEQKAQADQLGRFPFKCSVKGVDGGLRSLSLSTDEYEGTYGIHGNDFNPDTSGDYINFRGLVRTRSGLVQGKVEFFIGVEDIRRGRGRVIIRFDGSLINISGSRSLEVDPARLTKLKLTDGRKNP